jgi:hypothetical protein
VALEEVVGHNADSAKTPDWRYAVEIANTPDVRSKINRRRVGEEDKYGRRRGRIGKEKIREVRMNRVSDHRIRDIGDV